MPCQMGWSAACRVVLLTVGLGLAWAKPSAAQENWPQFRGPDSTGVAHGHNLPQTWSATDNIVWKTKIPGRGWSSPIVWGDRIFVTSAVQEEGTPETVKKGLYLGGERSKSKPAQRWTVYAIDWKTGKIVWEQVAHRGEPKFGIHLKNSYASETPVTDGKRVYAYFGNVGLYCYDLDGKLLWSKEFGSFPMRASWGTAASPVLYQNRLYIVDDNQEKSFAVALDAETGKEVWRVEREEKSNWVTPVIWENPKRTELITSGTHRIRSYDLNGKLLWELGGSSVIDIPTPIAQRDMLYVASGYVADARRPIFAIRPGASGDISLAKDQTSNQFIAWCQKKAGPYNPSPIVYDDLLYVLYDRGLLACYDAKTGKEVYAKQQIDESAHEFTASPWAYEGKIFCLSEGGTTFVIQADKQFKVLGRNPVGELCMATPAVARQSLLVRTESTLLRIEEPKK